MVLRLRLPAPYLWRHAKCLSLSIRDLLTDDIFFDEENPEDGKDYCNGTWDKKTCPIRHECLLFALANNQRYGVWGGTDEITRKAIRKKWPMKKEPRPEWRWMTKEQALEGLDLRQLRRELEKDTD